MILRLHGFDCYVGGKKLLTLDQVHRQVHWTYDGPDTGTICHDGTRVRPKFCSPTDYSLQRLTSEIKTDKSEF